MKGTESLQDNKSLDFVKSTAMNVISDHEQTLRADRMNNPGRFGALSRNSPSKILRVPQRVLGSGTNYNDLVVMAMVSMRALCLCRWRDPIGLQASVCERSESEAH